MDVSKFIFQYFFLSGCRSVLNKNMEYLTFIHIREEQGIMNLFKSFLSITSDKLFHFNITNDVLKLFSSISTSHF
jgi:hypothetical protein